MSASLIPSVEQVNPNHLRETLQVTGLGGSPANIVSFTYRRTELSMSCPAVTITRKCVVYYQDITVEGITDQQFPVTGLKLRAVEKMSTLLAVSL